VRLAVARGSLVGIEIEPAGEHLWLWFWDMNRGRRSNGFGPDGLSGLDLTSWQQMTGAIVRPEEWSIVRDMDQAYVDAASKKMAAGKGGPLYAPSEGPGLTAASFDGMIG